MIGAIVILVFTAAVGAVLWLFERRHKSKTEKSGDASSDAEAETEEDIADEECCGMHITCDKSSLSPHSMEIEYFDDEELDTFKGRTSDSYTEQEIDIFRDILLTLRPEEIASWARSIQLRGIELPPPVREELLMIVAEARELNHT